jgi:multidrug resistance efflux pump
MTDRDAERIGRLENEVARLRALVAEYAAEAASLRQSDQARARQQRLGQAKALSSEETDFAASMAKIASSINRRKSPARHL